MARASRTSRVATLIVAVVLGTGACGDAEDTVGTAAGAAADAGPESPVSTRAAPSTEPSSPGSGTDAAVVGDFCELNDELGRLFGELAARHGTDAEATWLNIEIVVEWLQQEAPPELADDVAAGAEYYETLGEALQADGFDDPVAIVESLPQTSEMERVESRVDDYLEAHC